MSGDLKAEIERLTAERDSLSVERDMLNACNDSLAAELDTMNNVHKHLATELADMGRERDRLRALKTPASAKLLNITKAALEHTETECDQLRAALAEIANNLIDSELASSEKRWMARRALAGGTKE